MPHPLFKCLQTTTEEEAPPPNGEAEEGDEQRKDEKMSEKLSNISSEDIEMASAKGDSEGEEGGKGQRTPGKILVTKHRQQTVSGNKNISISPLLLPFPGPAVDVSPLTPERNKTPNIVRGDVSPLTPPLPQGENPKPPPPPPPGEVGLGRSS